MYPHQVKAELQQWGMEFSKVLCAVKGRVLPQEIISMGPITFQYKGFGSDWISEVRSKQACVCLSVSLNLYCLLVIQYICHVFIQFYYLHVLAPRCAHDHLCPTHQLGARLPIEGERGGGGLGEWSPESQQATGYGGDTACNVSTVL